VLKREEQFATAREGLRIALEDAMEPSRRQEGEAGITAYSLALIALNVDEMPFIGHENALLVEVQP
jgi:hypothetical protein